MSQKIPYTFVCKECDYITSNKKDYKKHLLTRKHHNRTLLNKEVVKNPLTIFTCECGKEYTARNSLWYHKRSCKIPKNPLTGNDANTTTTEKNGETMELIKGVLVDISENMKTITTNNTMTNSHNTNNTNNFNMNFFLNETCKDAMNITDFIQSLKLTLADLEKVGELGYAEGISRMLVNGLNELEVTRRPIHCSDAKREVLHIKDQDKWEKDTPSQDKLRKAIRDLSNRNIMLMDDWRTENPGCDAYDHRKNDIYLRMVVESMGPTDEKKDFGKIIRAVARSTIVHKDAITAIE